MACSRCNTKHKPIIYQYRWLIQLKYFFPPNTETFIQLSDYIFRPIATKGCATDQEGGHKNAFEHSSRRKISTNTSLDGHRLVMILLSTSSPAVGGGTGFLIPESLSNCLIPKYHYLISIALPHLPHCRNLCSVFLDEFNSSLSFAATTPHEFIITGDFNIHLDNLSDHTTSQFLSLLSSFNLTQHVNFPIHNQNHILDLVITSSDSSLAPSLLLHLITSRSSLNCLLTAHHCLLQRSL